MERKNGEIVFTKEEYKNLYNSIENECKKLHKNTIIAVFQDILELAISHNNGYETDMGEFILDLLVLRDRILL